MLSSVICSFDYRFAVRAAISQPPLNIGSVIRRGRPYAALAPWFTDSLTCLVLTIQFCKTRAGKCPVETFLDDLSDRDAQKVAWVLRLVEQLEMVPQQYLKKLVGTEDLWEVRAQIGGNSYRLPGFFDGAVLLILTSRSAKKQQKTPQRESDLAHQRRTDYLQRRMQS